MDKRKRTKRQTTINNNNCDKILKF
jgi:hypothetical protein